MKEIVVIAQAGKILAVRKELKALGIRVTSGIALSMIGRGRKGESRSPQKQLKRSTDRRTLSRRLLYFLIEDRQLKAVTDAVNRVANRNRIEKRRRIDDVKIFVLPGEGLFHIHETPP
ncbi:MAG: hypothetical protein HY349_07400 [Nitrospirae bacterium]|nr:hypothetical protein [Nitrospirota bacterium]